jgi:hypothetical protein
MRFVPVAGIALALALALAGCIDPGDSTDSGAGSASWVQTDIAGADIDGDGRTDVITLAARQPASGTAEGVLKLYRQTSSGGFIASQILVGVRPWRLKIADVNGDGAPDLLVLDVIGGTGVNDDVLYLLLQDANNRGRFLPARTVATGLAASDFVVTDANLDLAPDIVTAGVPGGGSGAAQYLQRLAARGEFAAPTTLAIEGQVMKVAAADVGASGRSDLVSYAVLDSTAAASSPGQLVVNYSTLVGAIGSGSFFATPGRVMASYTGLAAQAIEVADVDGNGLVDIVTCFTPVSSAYSARISVVLQRPLDRVEVVDTDISSLSGLDGFVVADLNGDGIPDVATTGVYSSGGTSRSRTNILAPTVTGRYVQTATIEMPVSMSRIHAVDVDGDGLNDLILLGDSNRAYVMYQVFTARGTFGPPRLL